MRAWALFGGAVLIVLSMAIWPRARCKTGKRLPREQARPLFELIDKACAQMKVRPVHEVRLSEHFEIQLVLAPRLGLLGWSRAILVIGLPLLQSLSRKEFAAILARELAHQSAFNQPVDSWLYRLRGNWQLLNASLGSSKSSLTRILCKPLRRLLTYYESCSFGLALRQEHVADMVVSRFVDHNIVAESLVAYSLRARFLAEEYWPKLWTHAANTPEPLYPPHASMRLAMNIGFNPSFVATWIKIVMDEPVKPFSTHPVLRDRLLMLDSVPEYKPEPGDSAADSLLRGQLQRWQKELDADWLQANNAEWKTIYNRTHSASSIVAKYGKHAPHELSEEERSELGFALLDLKREEDALPLLRSTADRPNGSALAALEAGRILSAWLDEACLHYLNLAMERDAALVKAASEYAERFRQAQMAPRLATQ